LQWVYKDFLSINSPYLTIFKKWETDKRGFFKKRAKKVFISVFSALRGQRPKKESVG